MSLPNPDKGRVVMGLFKEINRCKEAKGFLFCGEREKAFNCALLEQLGKNLVKGKVILRSRDVT